MSRRETIALIVSGIICILVYWVVFAELNAHGGIKRITLKVPWINPALVIPGNQPSDLRYISPTGSPTNAGSWQWPMDYATGITQSTIYLLAFETGTYTNRTPSMSVTNNQEPPLLDGSGYPVGYYLEALQ